MNKILKPLMLWSAIGLSAVANGNEMVLNYDGFYDRIEDLNEPEYQGIKLAFYFVDQQGSPCKIESVTVKTKLKSLDVYHYPDGEILLPFDKDLDRNKAAIVIKTSDVKSCGLNMRLESSLLPQSEYSVEQLTTLIDKFDAGLDELSGMMSFMMPDVIGLTVEAKDGEVMTELGGFGQCNQGKCVITKDELTKANHSIRFNSAPYKLSPYIKN